MDQKKEADGFFNQGEIYVDPTYDWSFKRLFLEPGREEVLRTFLNDVLKGDLYVAKIKNVSHPQKEEPENKAIFFDVLCEDNEGRYFIIEMQRQEEEGFLKRLDYYRSRAVHRQLRPKMLYKDILPVVVVAICNFAILEHMFPDDKAKKLYFERLALVGLESGARPKGVPVMFHILDLKAFRQMGFPSHAYLEEWFDLFTCVDRKGSPLHVERPLITESLDRLEFLNLPLKDREEVEKENDREARLRGVINAAQEQGIEKGIAIGVEKGILASARKLLKKGYSPEAVADALELDVKEVLKLV